MKRVFLIVLDSFGIGALEDAEAFGDISPNTLKSISTSECFDIPNLTSLGLCNILGVADRKLAPCKAPIAAYGKCREVSKGKDTTTGHWELCGIVSDNPFPTYPDGFPAEVIEAFEGVTGRKVLCNKPMSGTQVIMEYGKQHEQSGDLIVYTSADSVFQIAAHEDVVSREKLYEYCLAARKILSGKHAVGRVIARPFVGEYPNYVRTDGRHDYSLEPTGKTTLDYIKEAYLDVISVGKISDIFAGVAVTQSFPTKNNADGMAKTLEIAESDFCGLCFVNLVDFDSSYGHRNDVDGYARAISEFDKWLPGLLEKLGDDDALIITADHGCDPWDISTDHTREFVPLLVYGKGLTPVDLGIRESFADVGKTVLSMLEICNDAVGNEFLTDIKQGATVNMLAELARTVSQKAYAPYSNCFVGAALEAVTPDGKRNIYTGVNIENASFTPTVCAERVAFFKAISEGVTDFRSISVCGGKCGQPDGKFTPCGVCRQVMSEFCDKDFRIYVYNTDSEGNAVAPKSFTLKELLPESFSAKSVKSN